MTTATKRLIDRMLAFNTAGSLPFDGYPTLSCADEELVHQAIMEEPAPADAFRCPIALMSYLASENVTTRQQYESAKAFMADYVAAAWACNMIEGSNPIHNEITEG